MGETSVYDKLTSCLASVRQRTDFVPKIALVLGSGLGDFAKNIQVETEISYKDIEGFPVSTVAGHDGKFIFGTLSDIPIVCMKGRVHYYEGYNISDVVLGARLMRLMGAEILFLTNAAGGMGEGFAAGDLMLITDHISVFAPNPLIGPNDDRLGTRFPDMTAVYDKQLCNIIKSAAQKENVKLKEGVYLQFTGPSYETPSEIRMAKAMGADAVGMSTVVEAIAARHMGMRVCGISCICNLASGISKTPLSHKEVQMAADEASFAFTKLVTQSIKDMKEGISNGK